MTRLFGKRVSVVVGGLRFEEHELAFTADASLRRGGNEATVELYNLGPDDRKAVETAETATQVVIQAGYDDDLAGGLPTIFSGRLRRVESSRDGADIVTFIEATSAVRAREYGRQLNRMYRSGTRVQTVVEDLLRASGIGEGSLHARLAALRLDGLGAVFGAPFGVSGNAYDSLAELLESSGFEVSTDGDELVVLGFDDALERTAVRLTPSTGLRGVPSADARGNVVAEAAMIPGIIPGRRVRIESDLLKGEYKVTAVTYTGSKYGTEFGLSFEGRPLRGVAT